MQLLHAGTVVLQLLLGLHGGCYMQVTGLHPNTAAFDCIVLLTAGHAGSWGRVS